MRLPLTLADLDGLLVAGRRRALRPADLRGARVAAADARAGAHRARARADDSGPRRADAALPPAATCSTSPGRRDRRHRGARWSWSRTTGGGSRLVVDELARQAGSRHQVARRDVGNVAGVAGGAILGDGRVGLILDGARHRATCTARPRCGRRNDTRARESEHWSSHEQHDADTGRGRRDSALAGKYLTFALAREEYGLPVLKVREIIKILDITAVPQAPPHVKGVDQPARQGDPGRRPAPEVRPAAQDYDERTCIIVVEIAAAGVGR